MAEPLTRQKQLLIAQLLGSAVGPGAAAQMAQPPVPPAKANGQLPANHPIVQQMQNWPVPREPVFMPGGGELMRRTSKIR